MKQHLKLISILITIILLGILGCNPIEDNTDYKVPSKIDSLSIFDCKFDFADISVLSSFKQKIQILDESILCNDTSMIWTLTGFNTYNDFSKHKLDVDRYPFPNRVVEINNAIYSFDIDGDGYNDIIFDNLDSRFETQQIFIAFQTSDGWDLEEIMGSIITNAEFEDSILLSFDTYEWTCCDYPDNIYREYKLRSKELFIKRTTAIPKWIDNSLISNDVKEIIFTKHLIKSYNLTDSSGIPSMMVQVDMNTPSMAYSETEFMGEKYVLTVIPIDIGYDNLKYNRTFGWVKLEDTKYLW